MLRHDQLLSDMAGGNAVAASTVRRWVKEAIELLTVRTPRLDRALRKIARSGGVVVLLDGTLIRTRRRTGADSRKNFSDEHKAHGLLFLALTDEKGNLIWLSAARPGRTSEITAARHNKITGHLREAGLGALADLGFIGLDDAPDYPVIITGRKATRNHRLTDSEKEANRLLNRERAAVEHGFANLKSWRFLTKIRMNARHAPTTASATSNWALRTGTVACPAWRRARTSTSSASPTWTHPPSARPSAQAALHTLRERKYPFPSRLEATLNQQTTIGPRLAAERTTS
ncbi:transposase [Streptomyces triculaminicus]|uniref:Transposase n=1 Tax=Streptomyces triculaminicus TaxID=2816232 RepID=A0A939FKK2_9ACTN|nr:transposase family protein [Streptomyces triculaminicus]MBO0653735.1 transposase [Streptomyces triculaminicus]